MLTEANLERFGESTLFSLSKDLAKTVSKTNGLYLYTFVVLCLAQKILNGLYPASPKVKCEPLPFLANGSIQPADCGVRPQEEGSKCTFQCNNGYSLKKPGRTSTVCKKANLYIPSTIKRLMPLILGITF